MAFLEHSYRLYPPDRFFALLQEATTTLQDDALIYQHVQKELPKIKPWGGDLSYGLPALFKQKREMLRQTLLALNHRTLLNGYLEVGSTGRHVSMLRKHLKIKAPTILVNESAPGYGLAELIDRGRFCTIGQFVPLQNYQALPASIPSNSVDLVSCYTGLHHCPPAQLGGFVRSLVRVLRHGGIFLCREHDASTPAINTLVSLLHTVYHLGLKQSWDFNQNEVRHFQPMRSWIELFKQYGLEDQGLRLAQEHDPSHNQLVALKKTASEDFD